MPNTKKSNYKQQQNREDAPNKGNKHSVTAAFGLAASLGFNLAACILVGVAAGKLADKFFATTPWLTIIGIVTGVLAGMWAIYKKITSF